MTIKSEIMTLARYAGLFFCLLYLAACSDRVDDDYFPLQPGHYWRYDMSIQTMDGNFDGVYAVENVAVQERDGHTVYVRRLLDGSLNYLQITEDGIQLTGREKSIDFKTTTVPEEQYIFRFPLQKGATWEEMTTSKLLIKTGPPQKTEFHIRANVPLDAVIETMTDVVRVPAGTFENCMRIVFKGKNFVNAGNYVGMTLVSIKETDWYAPGVGLVKSVRRETTTSKALDKGKLVLELENYR